MIEKTLSSSRPWLDKVPSPTGSEDSGLGWSPQGAGDCLFRLENSEKVSGNYFNYSESEGACSPSEQGGYKSWNDFDTNCKPDGNQADFQSYNIDQKPIADVLDSFWDQKPLANSAETKKTGNKANNKKKQATGDNSPRFVILIHLIQEHFASYSLFFLLISRSFTFIILFETIFIEKYLFI